MNITTKKIKSIIKFFIIVQVGISTFLNPLEASIIIIERENTILLQGQNLYLKDIFHEIRQKYGVIIYGLDHIKEKKVSLNIAGKNPEKFIKKLLRAIGENNYAFEFSNDALSYVFVFPQGKSKYFQPATKEQAVEKKEYENAVLVKKVLPGSQAEVINLLENDLIVQYDGIKIISSGQLASEVKKRSPDERFELIVIRDNRPAEYIVNGGLIGIQIVTKRVPKEERHGY